MKKFLIVGGVIVAMIVLSFGTGYMDVLYTKTVGKAKQNAETEVFMETKAYVNGMKTEALNLYKQYKFAEDQETKDAIEEIVAQKFAEFDENQLTGPVQLFVYNCKYN